jgi:hypothetical protein
MNSCEPIRLWNQSAPFATPEDATRVERFLPSDDGIERLTDVATPTLTFYPASGRGPHPAVLICPGGGYNILAWNHEGKDVAGWLNANGISAFLLKYRCPGRRQAALADAVRAMRLIRAQAGAFNLLARSPKRPSTRRRTRPTAPPPARTSRSSSTRPTSAAKAGRPTPTSAFRRRRRRRS